MTVIVSYVIMVSTVLYGGEYVMVKMTVVMARTNVGAQILFGVAVSIHISCGSETKQVYIAIWLITVVFIF